jgi:ABC-type Fe3+-hydroxamate transport system, periplasmic component
MRITKTIKIAFIFFACALMCLLLLSGCGNQAAIHTSADPSYSVTDMMGVKVTFKQKPKRILTLSMCTDQIVLGLVPSNHLVAIDALLDDPVSSNVVPLAEKVKTKIKNPGAEQIMALQPDLVIVPEWGKSEMVDSLRELGIAVVIVKAPATVEDVKLLIRQIAAAMGEKAKGEQLIALMDTRLQEITAKTAKIPLDKRKNVVLISLMTSYGGAGCIYDDACKYANVINGITAVGLKNGQALTKEMLVKSDPDLLLMPVYNNHGTFDTHQFNDTYLKDPSLQSMKAIRDKRIIYPRESFLYNCSQDVVYCIAEIARCAYGSEFDFPDDAHLSVSGEENR